MQPQNPSAIMRSVIPVIVCLVGLAGCRMYGASDSADLVQARLQASAQRLASELAERQDDTEAIARAAELHPTLAPLAERFAAVVSEHGRLAAQHAELVASLPQENNLLFAWVGPDRYRALHNAYGAVTADRQVLGDKYQDVLLDLEEALGDLTAPRAATLARYGVAPPFYARLISTAPSLEKVLAMVAPAAEQ